MFKNFDVFNAFLHPKRPNSKIPKNRKKCIFFKKLTFSKWPADHHGWSKTGSNDPPKCSKHISSPYLAFISILDHFLKNRKKSIFEKNFRTMHQQIWPKFKFSAENRPNIIRNRKIILVPLSEKNIRSSYEVFRFLPENEFAVTVLAKIPIFALWSFWLQKSIKNVKILFFSKSSESQLSLNIYIHCWEYF